ncbi:MAG: glycosyltransferase family 9 protein, partial [Candidatus Latescibacteria bacterium]|nr:glycosyltransferase family 9 protein [Candidatus Latescibacterota bacterium]
MPPRETPPAPRVDLSDVRRALVIRHRAGGDLLLTTPALRALKRGLPGAAVEVLTARGMSEILRGNPDIDRVLEFDRRSFAAQAALYAKLLRGGYDLVLDMVSNPRSAVMTALTRSRIRVGYDLDGRRYAYTLRVPREPVGS